MMTMMAMKTDTDIDIAQCSKLPTTHLTCTDWLKAHTMHIMFQDKILDILDKAENGEKVNPSCKSLYTTLHGLCKHNGTGHVSLK